MGMKHSVPSSAPGLIGGSDWDADHIIDGPLTFPAEVSEPTAPAAGNGKLYAANVGGRVMPKWMGAAGVDYPLQPHVGVNNVASWRGGNGATATSLAVIGSMPYTVTASSTQTPTLLTTSILNQSLRSRYLTSTTAGNVVFVRGNTPRAVRGNAANIGGFHYVGRFGLGAMNAAQRVFFGLWSGTTNPTNLDWTTDTATARIGLVANSASGNWRLAHNAAGAAPTLIDLGASFPLNTTDLIELALFCGPNASSISYRVRNLQTGAETTGTRSTNLPGNTLFLSPFIVMTNNTAAAAVSIDVVSVYLETDF